jgi:hypothetical protein
VTAITCPFICKFVIAELPVQLGTPTEHAHWVLAVSVSAVMPIPSTVRFKFWTLVVDWFAPPEPEVDAFAVLAVSTPGTFAVALVTEILPPADGSGPVSAIVVVLPVTPGTVTIVLMAVARPLWVWAWIDTRLNKHINGNMQKIVVILLLSFMKNLLVRNFLDPIFKIKYESGK